MLQGYYTPLLSDIARHLSINDADINWFEAAQLMLSAIVVSMLTGALSFARVSRRTTPRTALTGVFPGVPGRIAVVGLAEKGTLDLELTTPDAGGHASAPLPGGATARLARAVLRLDAPFPARVDDVVLATVDTVGRHAAPAYRALFAHAGLLRPLLAPVLARSSAQDGRAAVVSGSDPSPVSRTDDDAYALVSAAVRWCTRTRPSRRT